MLEVYVTSITRLNLNNQQLSSPQHDVARKAQLPRSGLGSVPPSSSLLRPCVAATQPGTNRCSRAVASGCNVNSQTMRGTQLMVRERVSTPAWRMIHSVSSPPAFTSAASRMTGGKRVKKKDYTDSGWPTQTLSLARSAEIMRLHKRIAMIAARLSSHGKAYVSFSARSCAVLPTPALKQKPKACQCFSTAEPATGMPAGLSMELGPAKNARTCTDRDAVKGNSGKPGHQRREQRELLACDLGSPQSPRWAFAGSQALRFASTENT